MLASTLSRFGLLPMRPRNSEQEHRAASPLELFFDLVFVVAVALSSAQLHHAETENHVASGVAAYLMVFFAIWWAWMNFTWFATSFDNDDWLYRVMTIAQMSGVLVLAAGTGPAMTEGNFALVTLGYVIMRLAMVTQWLRAAAGSPEYRATALRFAGGIAFVQILWVARLALPAEFGVISFLVLVAAEIAVPIWAEHKRDTPKHPDHIAERFGLFTLILLGESILASTNAVVDAIEHSDVLGPLILLSACGLVLAAGMWWIYFSREHGEQINSLRTGITFGYGHYLIFAAAGAFSAGIEVAIDYDTHATHLEAAQAALTLTVPVAVFVLGTWFLTLRNTLSAAKNVAVPVLAVALALSAFAPFSIPIAAAIIVAIVVTIEIGKPSDGLNHTELVA